MSVNLEGLAALMKEHLGSAYDESERNGKPFSVTVWGRTSTYHPTTCKCERCAPRGKSEDTAG